MSRLGVFGGSFNPVHIGHLLLARQALETLRLERVFFIPCAASADGKVLAPGRLRLAWLRAALKPESRFQALDVELRRGGISRTVDTLRFLRARWPGRRLVLLLGADQAARLRTWKEPRALAALAELAVFRRAGQGRVPAGFRGKVVSNKEISISSTEIRKRLFLKRSVHWLVPEAVLHRKDFQNAYKIR